MAGLFLRLVSNCKQISNPRFRRLKSTGITSVKYCATRKVTSRQMQKRVSRGNWLVSWVSGSCFLYSHKEKTKLLHPPSATKNQTAQRLNQSRKRKGPGSPHDSVPACQLAVWTRDRLPSAAARRSLCGIFFSKLLRKRVYSTWLQT